MTIIFASTTSVIANNRFVLGREKAKQKGNEAVMEKETSTNIQEVKQKVSVMRPTTTKPDLIPEVSLSSKKVKESSDDKETTMNVKQAKQTINPTITKPNLAPKVSLPSKKLEESSDEDDGNDSDSSVEGTYHFGNEASDENVSADEEITEVQSPLPKEKEATTIANFAKPAIKSHTDNTKQKNIVNNIKNERESKVATSLQSQKENNKSTVTKDSNAPLVSTTEHAANLMRIKGLEKELEEVLLIPHYIYDLNCYEFDPIILVILE